MQQFTNPQYVPLVAMLPAPQQMPQQMVAMSHQQPQSVMMAPHQQQQMQLVSVFPTGAPLQQQVGAQQPTIIQLQPQQQPQMAFAMSSIHSLGNGSIGGGGMAQSSMHSIGYNSSHNGGSVNTAASASGGGCSSGVRNNMSLGSAMTFGAAPTFPAKISRKRKEEEKMIYPQQPPVLVPTLPMAMALPMAMPAQQQQEHMQPPPPPPVRVVKKVAMLHADVLPIPDPEDKGPKQLIVNYIAPQVKISELFALFQQFGPLECAKILLDQDGTTKGFGFVYFGHSADAATAVKELQSHELHGKYLRIGYAVPQRAPPVKD